ncbi:LysR family transcriptional regulator [Amycolatopsis sp. NPDC023774]|uniref:LysR family transcriptional regulator n=1 Tax=Amycolatopsis sp. NPDC023774 TaxID=3155015 RepID=UPI0033F86859
MVEGTPAGIEFRHLRAFASVARLASFTHAAQELAITQPALSRTVRQLEQLLRVTLLDRSSRHVELTEAGRAFLEHTLRVLAELDRGVGAARRRGAVKLGFSWLLPTPWAQETVARFEHATGSSVDLVRIDDPLAAVQREMVDVALVRGPVRSSRLQVVHLFDEDRVAVFAETFPLAVEPELAWADVPNWPLVVNVVNGTTGPWSWPEGQRPATVVETANFDEWIESVATGRGLGVVPEVAVRRNIHPTVRFLPIAGAPAIPVALAFLPSANGPVLRQFVEAAIGR